MGVHGTNGGSICWNPLNGKYYAAMAGNSDYTIALFDKTGKCLTDTSTKTLVDVRGMWYNKLKKQICVNTYGNNGWYAYHLNAKGIPDKANSFYNGENQGGDNGVGFSDGSTSVYFLTDNMEENKLTISQCNLNGDIRGQIYLTLNADLYGYDFEELYNATTLIYTGQTNKEFGLLNYDDKQIELYSKSTGNCTEILKLPEETELYGMFNFGFANGYYFLFNKDSREWKGYK